MFVSLNNFPSFLTYTSSGERLTSINVGSIPTISTINWKFGEMVYAVLSERILKKSFQSFGCSLVFNFGEVEK